MLDLPLIRILQPEMAVWFAVLPLVIVFGAVHIIRKRRFRLKAGYGESLRVLSHFTSKRGDNFTIGMILLVSSLLVISLLRPQLRIENVVPEYEKQDLILILDRSVSMRATDMPPSRFARAIREIKSFLVNKPDAIDRVGLIGFAGTAVVLSHLTRDIDTLFFFLDWISEDPDIFYGTNFAGAIGTALEMAGSDESGSRKTFLLVSDGDDESTELVDYLNRLNDAGIKVHTVGIGTDQPQPIPLFSDGDIAEFLTDEEGNQLTTRFDESTMRQVAAMTNGTFFRSRSGHDLSDSFNDIVIQDLELLGYESNVDYRDLFVPLILVSLFSTAMLLIRV